MNGLSAKTLSSFLTTPRGRALYSWKPLWASGEWKNAPWMSAFDFATTTAFSGAAMLKIVLAMYAFPWESQATVGSAHASAGFWLSSGTWKKGGVWSPQ